MKRLLIFALAFAVFFTVVFPCNAGVDVSAGACVLMCAETGEIILSRNEDERLPIASLTKIMTALIAIETLDLSSEVVIPPEACGIEGSSIYLCSGEKLTVRDLLYSVLLESANDASTAIAIAASGNVEMFCRSMNEKAVELGLINTHFSNPHGLDADDHYSSAKDLAILTRNALSVPEFQEIVSTRSASIPYKGMPDGRRLINHNKLLGIYDGCIGVKTGYTKRCGRCLVSAARRDGVTLIAVTINDPNDWRDHAAMLDYGFSSLIRRELVCEGEAIDLPVVSGTGDHVTCAVDPLFCYMTADAGDVECILELKRFYFAPINEGAFMGEMVFKYEGSEIARSRVYACETVNAAIYKKTMFERIYDFFR